MKKAKENWTGEPEENLRTAVKQGKTTTVQDHSGKCLTAEKILL